MNKVTEAQVFLTRNCNQRCSYCKLTSNDTKKNLKEELTIEEWKRAFDNMKDLGIKSIKILGGEPTVKEDNGQDLVDLIEYVNKNTEIDYAILSNSIRLKKDKEFMERFKAAKPKGYYASVDWIPGMDTIEKFIDNKTSSALDVLVELKDSGVPILGGNCVVNNQNLDYLPKILEYLTNIGVQMNICTSHHANISKETKRFPWIFRSDDFKYKLTEKDVLKIKKIMQKLKEMKRKGANLATSDSYLNNFHEHGIKLNWKCKEFSQLRVDADGAIILCPDLRGKIPEKYNILTLNENNNYKKLKKDWFRDPIRLDCVKNAGCYWSSMYRAKENIKIGGEFQFEKERGEGILRILDEEENPILHSLLSELRDKYLQKDKYEFRQNLKLIGTLVTYEASKDLLSIEKKVETPLGIATQRVLNEDPVLVQVIRAGLPFGRGSEPLFKKSEIGFIWTDRDEDTLEVKVLGEAIPYINNKIVIIEDPMIGTSHSMNTIYSVLKKYGKPKRVIVSGVISSKPGIEKLRKDYPWISFFIATLDPKLNPKGYIEPGLGDAGDLCFGKKMNPIKYL